MREIFLMTTLGMLGWFAITILVYALVWMWNKKEAAKTYRRMLNDINGQLERIEIEMNDSLKGLDAEKMSASMADLIALQAKNKKDMH